MLNYKTLLHFNNTTMMELTLANSVLADDHYEAKVLKVFERVLEHVPGDELKETKANSVYNRFVHILMSFFINEEYA